MTAGAIAEALGPLRFNDFKNDFFRDLAEPVLETRGQIYQYFGDEVVVTWTIERGLRQGNCLRCVFLVGERIHEQKELEIEDMGERELRGKIEALRLYSLRARA